MRRSFASLSRFVPAHREASSRDVRAFLARLADVDKMVVLTGAGISTESGIPDYRSAGVGQYARTNHKPVQHMEFMKSEAARRRYWARNFLAWPRFSQARPNKTHHTLAAWERSDRFEWLITQNVDGLHEKAGSERVTELHGTGHAVKCTECGEAMHRHAFQSLLAAANPGWASRVVEGEMAPDGDVELKKGEEEGFQIPPCPCCGGVMKTDVVFFGDNVPRRVVDECYERVESSSGLLVLGSSLSVMSGYRFVYHASLRHLPVFIVNIGPTRADHLATCKLETRASDVIGLI